ncbi:MAG: cob(I)yrinic acid a,c-diamide adenosyltransferase [Chloroflexi bacterium]|nr:cob(I)yrinic acid a,c-diamide adenosyltransferase [Chloroflexota bacterium]MBU1750645.1 cob(I)yrinic acid a,c-diamide adenosyltransferase [Chloroflexota bacterium]
MSQPEPAIGLVQVYTGEGKGKTTAALGQALRAAGQGVHVYIIQFMKGWSHYGELTALTHQPHITLRQFGRASFVDPHDPDPIDVQMAQEALDHARQVVQAGAHGLVILDEVNVALDWGLIPLDPVLDLIAQRPRHVELVLTGRGAPPQLVEVANLVTEMRMIKHPYQQGITSRRGIDY